MRIKTVNNTNSRLFIMCREKTLHLFKPMEYLQKIIMYRATHKSIQTHMHKYTCMYTHRYTYIHVHIHTHKTPHRLNKDVLGHMI